MAFAFKGNADWRQAGSLLRAKADVGRRLRVVGAALLLATAL
jgi:hypothetical protein